MPSAGGFEAGDGGAANAWQSRIESANGNLTREEVARVARAVERRSDGVRNLGGQALSENTVDFATAQQERRWGIDVMQEGVELEQDRAELELAKEEVEHPEEFIGAEGSEILQKEWARDDEEDNRNSNGRAEIPFVGKIVRAGVQDETENTMRDVDELMKQKEFAPAQLVERQTAGSRKVLRYLLRRVGDRNVPESDNDGGWRNAA